MGKTLLQEARISGWTSPTRGFGLEQSLGDQEKGTVVGTGAGSGPALGRHAFHPKYPLVAHSG